MIPKLVVTAALMVAQMALTMTQRIKGPRLDELKVSVADYGTPLPRFWGIRRFEAPIFWAEDLKEVHTVTKTKGGKYDNYKYYGTFGIVVADQLIDGVTRIWFDKRLVYDTTKAGPVSVGSAAGVDVNRSMRVYLGTEDQTADPRYVTWCEDRYGPDSAPAYRGVAYIVFEEIPLEDFGNRIPTVTVEAVSVKAAAHPFETRDSPTSNTSANFVANGSGWMGMVASAGQNYWFDSPSRTYAGTGISPGFFTGSISSPSMASDGTVYFMGDRLNDPHLGNNYFLAQIPPLGSPVLTEANPTTLSFGATRALQTASGLTVLTSYATATGYIDFATHVDHAQSLRDSCIDADGNVARLFQPSGSSSDFTIECAGGIFTITGSGSRSGPSSAYICYTSAYDQFVVLTDGYFYAIDPSDGSVRSSTAATWGAALPKNNAEQTPNLTTIWNYASGFQQYSLEDGSLLQSLATSDWTSAVSNAHWTYDPILDALWTRSNTSGQPIKIIYLNRLGSDGVTLATVVDTVCGWCGLSDKDTASLTQVIDGYSVTQGSGKDMIDPLLTIHDVDARPHDFAVQFVNRGSAPSATILTSDFAREGDEDRYKVTIKQDTDLPKKVTFNFADKDKDQETNTAIAQRPLDAVDSQREETIDLSTYVADVDTAQQLADRYFRRIWNSREEISNSLTAQHLAIEPGDVETLQLRHDDGQIVTRNAKVQKVTISQGRLNCEWVRDETSFAAVNDATTGAPMEGRDEETITIPAPVKGFVLDAALVQDSDNDVNPLLYTGAGAYANLAYPGAAILRGDDGTYDELFETISTGATWGTVPTALANANANLWDRGNTLSVKLQAGSLTSVTEADIDADPTLNLIALGSPETGWEYLNFTTATLNGDGTYTLSGFKRGRRGTEWMTGSHGASETFVMLSTMLRDEMGTGDVGTAISFKCQSVGRAVDSAPAIDIDPYTGATLKPYAPARIKWTTDGTDMFGEIVRRTRVGGSWVGGSTIPLSENSEAYEVDILDGSGAVLRTITVSGTNTFTYTGAQIASDGGTVGVPPSYNAYQISDAVGRGYALAA